MKNDALIGYSGFVGSTLLKQKDFSHLYRSTNISEISNMDFDLVICAGAPAQKWLANKDPIKDQLVVRNLIDYLKKITCKTFVLISTVDVFKDPNGVYEDSPVVEDGLHTYGLNRRYLEKFVIENFDHYLIVRLPGLVGPGLRKNVIYDIHNNNNLHLIESRNVFQFYPMVNLWFDIELALRNNLSIVHLTAEPISVSEISKSCFGKKFDQILQKETVCYDLKSRFAEIFGGLGNYHYTKKESIQAIRSYAQYEPKSLNHF